MAQAGPRFAVRFDEVAWAEDVVDRYPGGSYARRVAEQARRDAEAHGMAASTLLRCGAEARDATDLTGLVKT